MSDSRCAECGAPVDGGSTGCQALMDMVQARAYSDPGYAETFDLGFDAYCMQHPEKYGVSAKSYAAHLTRLCCGVERGGEPAVYKDINRWLSTNPSIIKPYLLAGRGWMTVADVVTASDAAEHRRLVKEWAAEVWRAYESQHELAHQWIDMALHTAGSKRGHQLH